MRLVNRLIVPMAACAVSLAIFGCENQHPMNIPPTALISTEGNGVVTATAQHDGTVYVYDVGADRLDYSGMIMQGDTVTVNTEQNEILVNSKPVQTKTLNQGNKHRVYFDTTPMKM
jgi:hypothetical protein